MDLVSSLAAEFQCAICLTILKAPIARLSCNHSFCKSCLDSAIQHESRCPLCKEHCSRRDITRDETLEKAVKLFAMLDHSEDFMTQLPCSTGGKRQKTFHKPLEVRARLSADKAGKSLHPVTHPLQAARSSCSPQECPNTLQIQRDTSLAPTLAKTANKRKTLQGGGTSARALNGSDMSLGPMAGLECTNTTERTRTKQTDPPSTDLSCWANNALHGGVESAEGAQKPESPTVKALSAGKDDSEPQIRNEAGEQLERDSGLVTPSAAGDGIAEPNEAGEEIIDISETLVESEHALACLEALELRPHGKVDDLEKQGQHRKSEHAQITQLGIEKHCKPAVLPLMVPTNSGKENKAPEVSGPEKKMLSRHQPWPCSHCTYENPGTVTRCKMCEQVRGSTQSKALAHDPSQKRSVRLARGMLSKNRKSQIDAETDEPCKGTNDHEAHLMGGAPQQAVTDETDAQKDQGVPIHDDLEASRTRGSTGKSRKRKQFTPSTSKLGKGNGKMARILDEGSLESLAKAHQPPSQKSQFQKCKFRLLGSGLSKPERKLLEDFRSMTRCQCIRSFDSRVTHVICGNTSSGSANKTLKYMLGILHGKWILRMSWIEEMLKSGRLVPEEPHEVVSDSSGQMSGPILGRMSSRGELLKRWEVFLHQSSLNSSEKSLLEQLCLAAGATLLTRPPPDPLSPEGLNDCGIGSREIQPMALVIAGKTASPNALKLGQRPPDLSNRKCLCVSKTWLIDTCSSHIVQDPHNYCI